MHTIDKAIPQTNQKQRKFKKFENEFNCYNCFKIMILNLWSADQKRPVKIYGGGPRECSKNIYQHCMYMYLALTAYVLYLFLV